MGAFDVIANITVPDPSGGPASAAYREKHGQEATAEQEFRAKWGWEPHEQVIMRGAFTAGDHEAVQNATSPMTPVQQGKQVTELGARMGTGQMTMLERMVLDWTFTSGGRKVEVTPDMIRRLPSTYLTPLLEKCAEIAVAMTPEQQKAFLPSANGHTKENLQVVK
jgi:hypothetical protein